MLLEKMLGESYKVYEVELGANDWGKQRRRKDGVMNAIEEESRTGQEYKKEPQDEVQGK